MDITIEIGREAEGAHAIRVPSNFKWVGRRHATFYWHDGIATLVDNSSTNGTFVNGRRITQTQVYENDTVWLGGPGSDDKCYQLDLRRLFVSCREAENSRPIAYSQPIGYSQPTGRPMSPDPELGTSSRTDYSKEFAQLKQTYIDYHAEMSELKKKANLKMQLPRVLMSLIPIVVVAIILMIFREKLGMLSMVVMMLVSVLGSLLGVLTMGRNSSKQEKLTEDIMDLQLKYQNKYKCPKCGKQYSLDLHWKKLQADGKCPFGCGAQFI